MNDPVLLSYSLDGAGGGAALQYVLILKLIRKALMPFYQSCKKNASDSLANELGCHQFNITQDPQSPTKIFLYELYDDAVAFEMHKQASHYLEFNDAFSGMVDKKSVRLPQRINC